MGENIYCVVFEMGMRINIIMMIYIYDYLCYIFYLIKTIKTIIIVNNYFK